MRTRGLKTKTAVFNSTRWPRQFKNFNYDKIKFTFLDISKSQPFDLMYILYQFLCDKAQAPLVGVIFISGPAGRRDLC